MKIDGGWVGYEGAMVPTGPPVPKRELNRTRLYWAIGIAVAMAALMGPVYGPWFLLCLLVLIGVREIAPRRAQRQERARLLRDCHFQHDALMLGGSQDALAYFGRFQPAGLDGKISWCAPPEAFPTVSRVPEVVTQA